MAIKIQGIPVIDDTRGLANITNLKTVGGTSLIGAGDIPVASLSASATAPNSPSANQLWYDTTNGVMLIYYNNQWIEDYRTEYAYNQIDMIGGNASTTSYTYSLNCGGAT